MILSSKSNLTSIYVLKVNNRNTTIRPEICSRIKTTEGRQITSGKTPFFLLPSSLIQLKIFSKILYIRLQKSS